VELAAGYILLIDCNIHSIRITSQVTLENVILYMQDNLITLRSKDCYRICT